MDEWRAVAIDTLAGWAAGVVCTVAFQPVDTVLTRQQYEVRAAGAASVVLRQGGLWRGTAPLLALVPLQNALLMVGYGAGERWGRGLGPPRRSRPRRRARRRGRLRRALAQSFVASPLELAKGSPTPLSLTGAARDLLRREAAPGAVSAVAVLYRGLGLKLLRAVPSSGLNFFAYESAKRELEARWAV
ncbi:hypothetical protein JL720_385 [Aureococcus anophagefferens]|nr:hypothetical protein JL720_385 [Aureococcus anophagefferens]